MKKHHYLLILSVISLSVSITWFLFPKLDKNQDGLRDIELGDYESAVDKLISNSHNQPDDAEAFNNLGVAYHHLKEYELAIENFSKAIDLHPEYVKAYGNRGISYNDKGDFERALNDYNMAIQLAPYFENYYNNRGFTYKSLGRYDEAISDFLLAHDLNPKLEKAIGNLIITYKELNECEKVIKWCDYYLKLYSPRKIVYSTRAACKEHLGNETGAMEDYKLADLTINKRHPDEPKQYDNLTIANFAFGVLAFLSVLGIFFSLRMRNISKTKR